MRCVFACSIRFCVAPLLSIGGFLAAAAVAELGCAITVVAPCGRGLVTGCSCRGWSLVFTAMPAGALIAVGRRLAPSSKPRSGLAAPASAVAVLAAAAAAAAAEDDADDAAADDAAADAGPAECASAASAASAAGTASAASAAFEAG